MSRARSGLVLSYAEQARGVAGGPSPVYTAVRRGARRLEESTHEEELFGPAEGLHATYRMIRDEVLEASWRAGAALSEMRLDTADDVNRAVARFLELLKLAALIQRPGGESEREALAALNELLGRIATPEQLRRAGALGARRVRARRGPRPRPGAPSSWRAARSRASRQFIPRRGGGLGLSASDVDLYMTCPLKYKFARVFAIPQEPTINQRFGILVHNVLERYHSEELRGFGGRQTGDGGLERLLAPVRGGVEADRVRLHRRRAPVPRPGRRRARPLPRAPQRRAPPGRSGSSAASRFKIGDNTVGGRVDRVDRHPDGSYELIDYKTGAPKSAAELAGDLQIALYRVAARDAWDIEAADGSYWYVLDDEKVPAGGEPDALERVERTVAEVAEGITGQDFEPQPRLRRLLLVRLPPDLPGERGLTVASAA